ncbi:four-helix bundle copper-binding protein [Legionella sp. CNM-1927-20]|uniref:four-helix bundle copper-binding protein n=1 Tax=Legionella sp. CNM-1927-20 TaxID=3422221 RepID=UPI00403AD819
MAHEKYQACIEACQACAIECEHCATACLHEEDVKRMTTCIQLDWDCADICNFAAAMMARDSQFAAQLCRLCAEICRACGDECEKHSDMEHCKRCAMACHRCAEECERMAG